jgi:hypothetical protein
MLGMIITRRPLQKIENGIAEKTTSTKKPVKIIKRFSAIASIRNFLSFIILSLL